MARVARLSLVIRPSYVISPFLSKIPSRIKSGHAYSASGLLKSLSKFKFRPPYPRNFTLPGRHLILGAIGGVSVTFALVNVQSQFAYCMDGLDVLEGNPQILSSDASDSPDELSQILTLARKIWLPVLLVVTVLTNWEYPVVVVVKAVLLLLSTKPRPSSVYFFVEKLCNRCSGQGPYFYRYMTPYLTAVDVKDYKLICLARVQIRDQRFILIGILGGWWVLPSLDRSPFHEVLSVLRSCQRSFVESVRVEGKRSQYS